MLPYWLLFTLCAAGAVQYRADRPHRLNGGPTLFAAALFMLLMIAFRYEVGGDWLNYIEIFDSIRYVYLKDLIGLGDPGYVLTNWIALRLGVDIWFVNLICAAFFMWGLTRFVSQQPNPWLALVIAVPYLVIVVAMGYTRQAVAIGFILMGLTDLRDRQSMIRFAFYILLAAAFHKSAIIILPLAAFAATRNKIVMLGLSIMTGALLYYLFLSASIDRLMENYVIQEYDSQGAAVRVAMNLPPAILFLAFQRRFGLDEFSRKLWRNFSVAALGAVVLLMLLQSSTVVDRLALYLIPLQLFVFSRLPSAFADRGRINGQLTFGLIVYSALVQFIWLTSAANANYWVPYRVYPI